MDVEQRQHLAAMSGSDESGIHRWPPRVQRLVTELRALCAARLERPLLEGLDALDESLYQQAERSRSHLEQQRCFDSRALLRRGRAAFLRQAQEHVADSFGRMGESEDRQAPAEPFALSLLARDEHELTAAVEQLVSRGEAHTGPVLAELSYRLAVLVGAPPLEGAALPTSPRNLAAALRRALPVLDLPPEHQVQLVQALERKLATSLAPLYEAINAHLLADGVLPHLRAFAGARPANAPPAPPSIKAPPAAAEVPVAAAAASHEPITVLENLRDLLARQRRSEARMAGAGTAATPGELEAALGALQRHLIQVTDRASRELRSAQRLREELLAHLNAGKPAGAPRTALSPEQDDTVELVARLFEQLAQQMQQGPGTAALLGDMQLPILRVAMADRGFFEQAEHPARHLLGTLAEASRDWGDGHDMDADLAGQLSRLVARAQHEAPSAGLYTSLLADIRHHLAQLNRKAQVTERRQVEAAQGRERLHQARQRAAEVLATRFAESTPRGLLRALLDRAWSDVLALALLRHGEDSDAFAERLRLTDQLLGRLPVEDPLRLRLAVEDHLQQIGMQAEEAEQVAQRLIGSAEPPLERAQPPAQAAAAESPLPAAPTSAEPPSATDLALRLKQRQRLGGQHGGPSQSAAAPEPPLGPLEARIHNRLRQLPYGSWFDFVDPDTGAVSRRKLAWFSPLSGNSLFVNRRGQRVAEMNLRELAAALAAGRVRESTTPRESLFDRALRALTGSLQRAPARP